MTRKTAKPQLSPRRRPFALSDAAFVAAVRDAATAILEEEFVDPGWATFVQIAADELERFYAAGMVAPRLEESRSRENPE